MSSPLPIDIDTDSEDNHSSDSSFATVHLPTSAMTNDRAVEMTTSLSDTRAFGTPIQQFTQRLRSALSKYVFEEKLNDGCYAEWAQDVKEVLRGMDYFKYLKKIDYKAPGLSDIEHKKVKFILTTWMLEIMDTDNSRRCRIELTVRRSVSNCPDSDSDDEDEMAMTYEPHLLWKYLRNYHFKVTEAKLRITDDTLHDLKISRSDSYVTHCDKYNQLLQDYFRLGGEMSDAQSARLLIKTIKPRLTEVTTDLIYTTVHPLTRQGLIEYLKEYETRHGGPVTPAVDAVHHAEASSTSLIQPGRSGSRRGASKCTEYECVGQYHTANKCFAKPKNFKLRDEWIAKKEQERNGSSSRESNSHRPSQITGMKRVALPSNLNSQSSNSIFASLHASFDDSTSTGTAVNCLSTNPFFLLTVEEGGEEPDTETEVNTPSALPRSNSQVPWVSLDDPCLQWQSASAHQLSFEDDDVQAHVVDGSTETWALHDTGATHNMFKDRNLFVQSSLVKNEDASKRLKLAGGEASLAVHSKGTTQYTAGNGHMFELKNCLYVPDLACNLLAGGLLCQQGVDECRNPDDPECFSLVLNNVALFNGTLASNNLMYVVLTPVSDSTRTESSAYQSEVVCSLQHRRLGHIGDKYFKLMCKHGSAVGLMEENWSNKSCVTCALSKNHKIPHNHTRPRASKFLENVHVDLSGIIRTKGLNGEMYYILFCDDFSSYRHIYALWDKTKEEVFEVFITYLAMAERQTGCDLIRFTLDRGGEFINSLLGEELRRRGIIIHATAPHSPEQNGVSERGNRTIGVRARSMMLESSLPLRFWYLTCVAAVYLTNRIITAALPNNKTPFEMWHFRKPNVDRLRVFGCQAFSLIRKELRSSKFSPVSSEGVLVGFEDDNFNYHIYDMSSKKVIITHHATFNEDVFPFGTQVLNNDADTVPHGHVRFFDDRSDSESGGETCSPVNRKVPDEEPAQVPVESAGPIPDTTLNEDNLPNASTQQPPPISTRRSSRLQGSIPSYKGMGGVCVYPESTVLFDCIPHDWDVVALVTLLLTGDPKSFKRAINGPDGLKWLEACRKEIQNMISKHVFTLVDRPVGVNVIRGLWLFKRKLKTDGTILKFKARFVAMGNTQIEGVDYLETFAPTGKPASLRLLFAIAALNGWEVHQMDAVAAFLNSTLDEVIYVEQPEGFVLPGNEGKVWLLNRALYGLKQSPKYWQDDVQRYLVSIGFEQCEIDHCIYIRSNTVSGQFTAIYVHVDDMAITGNDISSFKAEVSSKWEMDDLGPAEMVVGIEINRPDNFTYSLSQAKFATSILMRFEMEHSKPASTPLASNLKLYRATDEDVAKVVKLKLPYRSAVGSLMYLAQCTRPDLAHAVGVLSQHLDRPGIQHWDAAMHVFRYLAGTTNLGIVYSGNCQAKITGLESSECPQSHCDADWAGDKDTRRSTTGYIFTLAGGALTWRSRLQPTVALSSTEAEYRAITEAGQELIWLRNMMARLGYIDHNPTVLKSDNVGAIHLTSKSIFHGRTKHIEIHYHWIREVVNAGLLKIQHCASSDMVADLLTKCLGKRQFIKLRKSLGMSYIG